MVEYTSLQNDILKAALNHHCGLNQLFLFVERGNKSYHYTVPFCICKLKEHADIREIILKNLLALRFHLQIRGNSLPLHMYFGSCRH